MVDFRSLKQCGDLERWYVFRSSRMQSVLANWVPKLSVYVCDSIVGYLNSELTWI